MTPRLASLALRLPADLIQRADRLVGLLNERRPAGAGAATRSTIVREAIERGIADLEREHGVSPPT